MRKLVGTMVLLALSCSNPAVAVPQTLKIFPGNGQINFSINLAMNFQIARLVSAVRGTFDSFQGRFVFDPDDIAHGSIRWDVLVSSINTGIAMRDKHLASSDYFDVNRYPRMTFVSNRVQPIDRCHFMVFGTFTMRGVAREISVPLTFQEGWLDSRFSILRSDYGFTSGAPAIADRVDIHLRLYPSPSWFPTP